MPGLPLFSPALKAAYLFVALGACAPEVKPRLEFTLTEDKPVWSHARSSRSLHAEAPPSKGFPITGGLTKSEIADRYRIEVSGKKNTQTGLRCIWPSLVKVNIHYSARVYIAREFREGRCGYTEAKAHEERHLAADHDELKGALPRLRARAAAAMTQPVPYGPFDEEGADRTEKMLLENVSTAVHEELEKVIARIAKRQAEIDTPDEYRRFSRACPNEPLFGR